VEQNLNVQLLFSSKDGASCNHHYHLFSALQQSGPALLDVGGLRKDQPVSWVALLLACMNTTTTGLR
jgi:hypothetical protein